MTVMTAQEATEHVIQTNAAFSVAEQDIRGVTYRVFENAPHHVAALLHGSREAQGNGAAEYLVFEEERWTFDAFIADVNRMAHVLRDEFGVTKGTPVAIAMRNCPELMIMVMACASLGALTVFVNAWWTTDELDYALQDSGARLVFADGDRISRLTPLVAPLELTCVGVRDGENTAQHSYSVLKSAASSDARPDADIAADDDFAVMYSSGTTGRPKGVVQTHRGAVNAVFSWLFTAVIAPLMDPDHDPDAPAVRPSVLIVTPLFHVTATHPMFLLSLPAGAMVAVMPKWDARKAVEIIRDEKITRFLGVPTQSADLMIAMQEMGETLPTLDYIGAGGAKRPPAQVGELAELLPNAAVATGWGMTETNALGIGMIGDEYNARPEVPPANCIRLLQDVRLLDDDG